MGRTITRVARTLVIYAAIEVLLFLNFVSAVLEGSTFWFNSSFKDSCSIIMLLYW